MSVEAEFDPVKDEDSGMLGYRDSALDTVERVMDSLHASASVEAVYGVAVKQHDTMVIPAAEVVAISGFGFGQGFDRSEEQTRNSGGAGGGGGGSAYARPVAVIIVTPDGVRVEPIFDLTKIALAGVTFAAFTVGMLARLRKMQSSFKKMSKAIE